VRGQISHPFKVGNPIERLNGDTERRYKRLPKRLGGLSVAP